MSKEHRRIIIVDDEEAILFAFKDILSEPLLTIDTAQTVEAAEQLLIKNVYNGAILDLRLSGTKVSEGFAIIQTTKKYSPYCKIIVLTAYAQNDTKEKVFQRGADFFVEKPASPQEIKTIFQSIGVL